MTLRHSDESELVYVTVSKFCEDFPCCGHELNDCDGSLYGSDESIQNDPHLLCDHNTGECAVWNAENDFEDDNDDA